MCIKKQKKSYEAVLDKNLEKYRKDHKNKMRNMRTSNPTEFWKILNSNGSHDKNYNSDIYIDTLFDFFSDLNKGENNENDADVFKANINMQQPNDALNDPITKDEI